MHFSKKAKLQLFALLLFLNLIMRIPISPHEQGIDSFEMHMLANSVTAFGEARWWVHPLSVIGMYPNSYASGISFFVSGMSQVTGLDLDKAILVYSLIGSLFVLFASYMVAGAIYDDDIFKFFVAFAYSLSPGIIEYTTWTAQGRSFFLLVLPLLFYLLLKSRSFNIKCILLCLLAGIFVATTHHMFFYLLPIVAIYLFLLAAFYIKRYITLPSQITSLSPLLLLSSFAFMFAFPFATHKFMTLGSRWANLANLPIEYPRYAGIAILLSAGGFLHLVLKKEKEFSEWFILLSVITLTVFIFQTMYTKWIMIFFIALLAGRAFINLSRISSQGDRFKVLALLLVLVFAVSFSGYFQFIKEYDHKSINENTFNTGLWIRNNLDDGIGIGNSRWETWKIGAVSGATILTGSSSTDQAYGLVNSSTFELATHPITSEEFWIDSPYYRISGKVSDSYWQLILAQYYSSKGSQYINYFNITYLIDYTQMGNDWFSHHGRGVSDFVIKVHQENDCIYDSGKWNLWKI